MSKGPQTLVAWLDQQFLEFADLAKNSWLTLDRRTLGLTRIILGFFLLMDLWRRSFQWEDMFSDKGVLPNIAVLERPPAPHTNFSLLLGFTTAPELWALFAVIFVTFTCLLVGYRTKVAQILSLVFITSMNGRVLLIENGGYVVQNLLLLWTCFMPLGDRFSVDAMLASMRRRRERSAAELNDRTEMTDSFRLAPYVSLVGLVLCIQIAAIYYFNKVHKFGPGWVRDWTAVHQVMYVDRMVTPLIARTREYLPYPALQLLTISVLAAEAMIGFCTLLPQLVIWGFDVKLWLKRIGLVLINFLHIGFGSTFVLGPFAWSLCVFSTLFFSYEDWAGTIRYMRKSRRARVIVFDPRSGAALWVCRVLARMDRFALLTFEEASTAGERDARLAVALPGSAQDERRLFVGSAALRQILHALPGGPIFSWIVRVPPISWLVDAAWRTAPRRASRFFGMSTDLPAGREPSTLRFRFKAVGRIASELACLVMFLAALNQALVELWSTQRRWKEDVIGVANKRWGTKLEPQSDSMKTLTHKMRFLQGWFMFSPNPVTVDGTIIVDAVTVDGRHIDPFMLAPPNFDLVGTKSFGYNQIWSDYFNRIQGDGARPYQKTMLEYMRRLPERTGNPNDALVSGEVYWVSDRNPRPKTTQSWGQEKKLLFTFGPSGPPQFPRPNQ